MSPEERLHERRVGVVANAIGFAIETMTGGPVDFEERDGIVLPVLALDRIAAARYRLVAERVIAHLDRFDASPRPSLWEGS